MNPTYLINTTSENGFYFSDSSKISDIISTSFNSMIGILVVLAITSLFLAAIYFYRKSLSGSFEGVEEGKEQLRKSFIILISLTLGSSLAFSLLGTNFFTFSFLDLSPLNATKTTNTSLTNSSNTSTEIPKIGLGVSCVNPEVFKTNLSRGIQLCSATICKGICKIDAVTRKIVIEESENANVDYHNILALICRESRGIATKQGMSAKNGKVDCGLMQINSTSCTPDIMDVRNNIKIGINQFKQKLSSRSVSLHSYQGITKESMAFAAYNCCANGDDPNSKSVDCNISTGFPYDLPKWACPINPGNKPFNMCDVKDYACDVSSCAKQY